MPAEFEVPSVKPKTSADGFADSATGPSLFTALQDQLGLRSRAQKISVPILVVDSIDRVPSGN